MIVVSYYYLTYPLTYPPHLKDVLTFALLSSSFLTVRTVSPELITKS